MAQVKFATPREEVPRAAVVKPHTDAIQDDAIPDCMLINSRRPAKPVVLASLRDIDSNKAPHVLKPRPQLASLTEEVVLRQHAVSLDNDTGRRIHIFHSKSSRRQEALSLDKASEKSWLGRSNITRLPAIPKELVHVLQNRKLHSIRSDSKLVYDVPLPPGMPCLCRWIDCSDCNPAAKGDHTRADRLLCAKEATMRTSWLNRIDAM